MKLHTHIFLLILTLLFTGCSHFTSPARKHKIEEGKYWLDYDASRRGAFFIASSDGKFKTCAEPSPDVAYKLAEKLETSVTYGGATGTGKGDFSQDVVKLSERTQMIMFLREALFRLCELSLNTDLSDTKYVELYEKVLNTSLNASETAKTEAQTLKTKAQRELEETKAAAKAASRKL